MAYAPDMGAAGPAPTWMGGHSSIEQNPIMQLVQWLMQQQQFHSQSQPGDSQQGGLGLDPTFNLPRPNVGGMPQHPGGGGGIMEMPGHYGGRPGLGNQYLHALQPALRGVRGGPGRQKMEHVANIAAIAKQLAGNHQINRAFQPHLNRVSMNRFV